MKKNIVKATLVFFSLIVIGCGARSELTVPDPPVPVSDTFVSDATDASDANDASESSVITEAAVDVVDAADAADAADAHVGVIHVILSTFSSRAERIVTSANPDYQMLGDGCFDADDTEPVDIDRINVGSLGDAASYLEFLLTVDGHDRAVNHFPPGTNSSGDLDLTANPIQVEAGGGVCYILRAHLAPVVTNATAAGATSEFARSGALVGLGINIGLETGAWDSSYRGHYNVRARGRFSGRQLYAEAPSSTLTFPEPIVVYRTHPVIELLPVDSTTLVNGAEVQFLHWRVLCGRTAPPVRDGTIAWLQQSFLLGSVPRRRYQATGLRLLRNRVMLPRDQVSIVDFAGRDVTDGVLEINEGDRLTSRITIVLAGEEIVNETGTEYILVGMISTPVVSGDTLDVHMFYPIPEVPGTFYLTDRARNGMYELDASPWTPTGSSGTGSRRNAAFIWSDLSDAPHFDAPGISGGSRDWIGEAYLY